MQWNANGLKLKTSELETRLNELEIDVAVIQETHLSKKDRTPMIQDFKAVRVDRTNTSRGGGLAIYLRESLPFENVGSRIIKGTETSTIRVRLDKKKWVTLTNLYSPPVNSKGQEIAFSVDHIPSSPSSIICGDFNAHHATWDEVQPEDDRGTEVSDWVNLNSMAILNNGSVTRHNPSSTADSSKGSTPDVTICGSVWEHKAAWAVDDTEIGGSDHLPIIITLKTTTKHQPIIDVRTRWRSSGVDWPKFREAVEASIVALPEGQSLNKRIANFTEALISAAKVHVRKAKPRKKQNNWLTPEIKRLIKTRNDLRRKISTRRKAWREACKAVTTAKQEARRDQWKEIVSSAIGDLDERHMWQFIKSLNGSPDTNSPNEALKIDGKRIVSPKKKAEKFAQHYAAVSKLKLSKADRKESLRLKRLLNSNITQPESFPDFTMQELETAIKRMRRKGAPGEDDVPPSFLKELGPAALKELLAICNQSLRESKCPQSWLNAIIIPLLKAGKSSSLIASHRPVSLTSCVCKALERMFSERLYFMAESNGWFASIQAGFRRGHSCADQIIRITQAIEDGFQQTKMNRAVLVLLDYSKAFDMVWRQRLLLTMAEKGVPLICVKWLAGFLSNRRARVRLHGALSSSKPLRQGVPQGCVLSPLLFLFFINNLAERLVEEFGEDAYNTLFSLFADDVGILCRDRDRNVATANAQKAVDVIANWSRAWKLELNGSKSEVSFFSTWTHESDFKPIIEINDKALKFQEHPRLLGVTLDRQLTFTKHVEEVTTKAVAKTKMISAVSHSEWGWDKQHLTQLYHAYVRSQLDYAGPGWQPWLSDSNRMQLERAQNKALRRVTGQMRNSPVEALRYGAGVPTFDTQMKRNCLKSTELARRLPSSHPRRIALDRAVPRRNDRTSWAHQGNALTTEHIPQSAEDRLAVTHFVRPPWNSAHSITINSMLEGVSGRHDDQEKIRAAAEAIVSNWTGDLIIYTDGSAVEGCRQGGAAAVVHMLTDPPRTEVIMRKGAEFTSSFEEESQAMLAAANWIQENCDHRSRALILTDSQSVCRALQGAGHEIDHLRMALEALPVEVTIQFVPGHCGIPGNEEADVAANTARTIVGPRRPTSQAGILPHINREIIDAPCREEYQHISLAYSAMSAPKERAITSREDQVYLDRLRAGEHPHLRYTANKLNPAIPPNCPRCGHEEERVTHWIECPGTLSARQEIFGTVEVDLSALTRQPQLSIALARRTLRAVGKNGVGEPQ
jgi:ribonuclease HI